MKISWNCAQENGADICVDEGQKLSNYRVNLTEEGEKSILDRAWFSMKRAVLECATMYSSNSHVDSNEEIVYGAELSLFMASATST